MGLMNRIAYLVKVVDSFPVGSPQREQAYEEIRKLTVKLEAMKEGMEHGRTGEHSG